MMDCCASSGGSVTLAGGRATASATTVVAGPGQSLQLTTVEFDDDGCFNIGAHPDRMSLQQTARYLVGFQIDFNTSLAVVTETDFRAEFTGVGAFGPAQSEKVRSTAVAGPEVELSADALMSLASGTVITLAYTLLGGWAGGIDVSGALWYLRIG